MFVRGLHYLLAASQAVLLLSCSGGLDSSGWTVVPSGERLRPIPVDDVEVVEMPPSSHYVKVGHMEPPPGRIVKVSMGDEALVDCFRRQAASLGANTVVLQNYGLRYKSGKSPGTKVLLLYAREESNTHGGDDVEVGEGLPMIDSAEGRLY